MKEDKTFQQAVEAGLIDLETLRIQLRNQEKQKVIENHPYSIWPGKDGKWRTYVSDRSRKNNRRLIKRTTEDALHEFLYQRYLEEKEAEERKRVDRKRYKLSDFFPVWLRHKEKHTNASSYISRIVSDWNKYYRENEISSKFIDTLSEIYLDDWCHEQIKKRELTKVQFYNMSIILRQGLRYAKNLNLIDTEPFSKIVINTKMFRHIKKPPDETQVFLEGEQEQIVNLALAEYHEHHQEDSLAVGLNFQFGLRSGELSTIKETDIENEKYLHIQRMETKDYDLTDIIHPRYIGKKVVEYTKTSEGNRFVYLTNEARRYLKEVGNRNKKLSLYDDGFIFLKNGKRMDSSCLNQKLEKYCRKIGIPEKRIHKIRKTYVSALVDGGININEIRKLVGHTDEKTTFKNYCFNRKDKYQTEKSLEMVIKKHRD